MGDADIQKLKVRLGHWIEHNREHGKGFEEAAKQAESAGHREVHRHIMGAARRMEEAAQSLRKALEVLEEQ